MVFSLWKSGPGAAEGSISAVPTVPARRRDAPTPSTRPAGRLARAAGSRLIGLAGMLTTPLLPSDFAGLVAPLHLGAELRGRVVARRHQTQDAVTLSIRPGRGWRAHRPGQYVRIGVEVDGVRHWRAYSLTSTPDAAVIDITVKRLDGGLVSTHLVDDLTVGTLLMLDQATGDFVLPDRLPARTLFLTAGSGITPVMGMLRSHPQLRDVVLVHSCPTPADSVFGAELRELATSGRIRLIERHTQRDGQFALADLDQVVPDWRFRHTWACGPTGLLDDAQQHWDRAAVTDRLHTERFRPAVAAAGQGGVVTFTRTGRHVDTDGSAPLLDAGENAGVLMPSGCRMGICFGCAAPLRDGTVRDLRNGTLTTAAPGDGVIIQTCISAAAGPCSIDL